MSLEWKLKNSTNLKIDFRKCSPIRRRPLHMGNKQVYKNNSIKSTGCDKQNQRFLSQMGFQNKQI